MSRYPGFNTYMEFERGFHGWLVFFFVTSCIAACLRAFLVFQTAGELRLALQSANVLLPVMIVAFLLIRASLFVATIVGLVMFAKADSRTPTFWAVVLIASMLATTAQMAFGAYEATLVNGDGFVRALWSRVGARELWGVSVALAWVLYWMHSKRVRLTFGRNAFSAMPSSPIESVAPVT